MDSSSSSTSAYDSTDLSDVRNGEGLVVAEIMRMKEKRLRLLDNFRNEQEENILPLMREAEDINRKRKKKQRSQLCEDNNTPLRRSERIMTQTLNENGTFESPMHLPQEEPDPMYEPEFEQEPAPMPELETEPAPVDEFEQEPAPMPELEPEPAPVDEFEQEPAPMPELEPESAPADESEQEPAPMPELEPEPAPADESEQEPAPMPELVPEPVSVDEFDPEIAFRDEFEQQVPPMRRHVIGRMRAPRRVFELSHIGLRVYELDHLGMRVFELERLGRRVFDVQLPSRRIFAVYPAPRSAGNLVPVLRWRLPTFASRDNWYGPKDGFDIGYHWNTRLECSHDKVHRPSIAGIHAGPEGAYSVALSGIYPEDTDQGNMVMFTGAGGRDLSVRRAPQVRDQELNKANLSLIISVFTGNPVRLIRGHKLGNSFAPNRGYRYDGLYRVVYFDYVRGHAGFFVFRFKLCRLENQTPPPWETRMLAANPRRPPQPRPRAPTPPPSTSTAPPSISGAPPSTSEEPPNKKAKVQNKCFPETATYAELDNEIESCILKLCRNSHFELDDDEPRPFSGFRGWNVV